jgi:hypothetical protein
MGANPGSKLSYVTMQNIDIRHGGLNGIFLKFVDNVTVQNCTVKYIGGGFQVADTVQVGEGIECNDGCTNVTIYNNTVSEIFEGGISIQSTTAGNLFSNIVVTYNNVSNSGTNFMFQNSAATATTGTITIDYNVMSGLGEGWSYDRSISSSVWAHFLLYNVNGSTTGTGKISFRYNDCTGGKLIEVPTVGTQAIRGSNYIYIQNTADFSDVIIDFNRYLPTSTSNQFAYTNNNTTTYATTALGFAAWKTASGQDANSELNPSQQYPMKIESALGLGIGIRGLGK